MTIKINDKEYKMKFPSLRQGKKLGQAIGFDIFKGNIKEIDWVNILDDETKTMNVLKLLIDGTVEDSILDELTAGDVSFLVSAFFLKMQEIDLKPNNGMASLVDIINQRILNPLPLLKDTHSTLQSLTQETEIPKQ